ncbi:MAG: exosortase system-associated protein, TIGR04073 family [Candidatus Omnitrophica bacterium]|nr:exosortase system-associated protein, TIGR04073 family [Candidatus Omnitrophota bacterium]
MSRRTIAALLVIFMLAAAFTGPAYCNDMFKKLSRGVCNIGTFPSEVYFQYVKVAQSDGIIASLTWGILKGVCMSGVRLAAGVYEVVTFPFPIPEDYEPILTDPEFVGEYFSCS